MSVNAPFVLSIPPLALMRDFGKLALQKEISSALGKPVRNRQSRPDGFQIPSTRQSERQAYPDKAQGVALQHNDPAPLKKLLTALLSVDYC